MFIGIPNTFRLITTGQPATCNLQPANLQPANRPATCKIIRPPPVELQCDPCILHDRGVYSLRVAGMFVCVCICMVFCSVWERFLRRRSLGWEYKDFLEDMSLLLHVKSSKLCCCIVRVVMSVTYWCASTDVTIEPITVDISFPVAK